MRISYNWLQTYFEDKLPEAEKIADGLIFHSFEVEDIEKTENDTILDVKILPDRAHDCLCHVGVAREISAIFELKKPVIKTKELIDAGINSDFKISIEEPGLCRRYIGRVVRDIEVGDSSHEVKQNLQSIGQRSINNIVDSANYVMFEMGQPLHAFDLDKIQGSVVVRKAKNGESIITLDDKQIELNESDLVIADDLGPLAIAGVKGGKRAGVTNETKNLLLESANFEPVGVRRTATRLNLHTDASKRFENDYPEILAKQAINLFSGLISLSIQDKKPIFEDIIDIFPVTRKTENIIFTVDEITSILGVKIEKKEIINILERLGVVVSDNTENDNLSASIPSWRLDLNIREDLAEDVGRIYGYEKIENILPEKKSILNQNKDYLVSGKIKEIMFDLNFSEVMGYSFESGGEVEVLNPLANDKAYLRKNIYEQFEKKIEFNLRNAIFSEEPIKIFEIGNVFDEEGESTRLCLGVGYKTKKLNKGKKILEDGVEDILSGLQIKEKIIPKFIIEKETYTIFEFKFNDLAFLSSVSSFGFEKLLNKNINYRKISEYPRVIRDIALFVTPDTDTSLVSNIITENSGLLLFEAPILFDVFDKKDESGNVTKRSLAFRMIYQSYEKTLSDEEINTIILNVISKLEEKGFEVRK